MRISVCVKQSILDLMMQECPRPPSDAEIARAFGVSRRTVGRIRAFWYGECTREKIAQLVESGARRVN